jgi:outer membrane protein OmpA-like peptidoglycan-associated protein
MKINFKNIIILGSTAFALVACGSAKQQAMLETIHSPQTAPATFSALETDFKKAERDQVHLISPERYLRATSLFQEAEEMRREGAAEAKYNEKLVEARRELDAAVAFTKLNKDQLKPLVDAREIALRSGAADTTNKELKKLEENYLDLVNDLDSGRYRPRALARIPLATKDYQDLTTRTLQAKHLGEAKNNLILAKNEGAEKLVPQTLSETEASIQKTSDFIAQNRSVSNWPAIEKMGEKSTVASRRLLKLTRETGDSANLTPEERALKAEASVKAAGVRTGELQKTLQGSQQKVSDLQTRTEAYDRLEMRDQKNKNFETVRKLFTQDEAKVYRQGDNLVISLKKVNFSVNDSSIPSASFGLLKKVQDAIQSFEEPSVVIEGHTDSTGDSATNQALSEKRAEAVRAYFLANNAISLEKLEAIGFGSEKPLASNESPDGRAINRRIDVVIVD